MNLITSTLNDFYHCCKIPVKAISYELNEIYKIGYNEEFETYFPITWNLNPNNPILKNVTNNAIIAISTAILKIFFLFIIFLLLKYFLSPLSISDIDFH